MSEKTENQIVIACRSKEKEILEKSASGRSVYSNCTSIL